MSVIGSYGHAACVPELIRAPQNRFRRRVRCHLNDPASLTAWPLIRRFQQDGIAWTNDGSNACRRNHEVVDPARLIDGRPLLPIRFDEHRIDAVPGVVAAHLATTDSTTAFRIMHVERPSGFSKPYFRCCVATFLWILLLPSVVVKVVMPNDRWIAFMRLRIEHENAVNARCLRHGGCRVITHDWVAQGQEDSRNETGHSF